jgi:hypothetical protein
LITTIDDNKSSKAYEITTLRRGDNYYVSEVWMFGGEDFIAGEVERLEWFSPSSAQQGHTALEIKYLNCFVDANIRRII